MDIIDLLDYLDILDIRDIIGTIDTLGIVDIQDIQDILGKSSVCRGLQHLGKTHADAGQKVPTKRSLGSKSNLPNIVHIYSQNGHMRREGGSLPGGEQNTTNL